MKKHISSVIYFCKIHNSSLMVGRHHRDTKYFSILQNSLLPQNKGDQEMYSLNETGWPRQFMILDRVLEQKMNSSEKTGKIQIRAAINSFVWILFASSWSAQLCRTLYDPMDCSPPGSSVHGNFQARILEWVAVSFSRGSSHPKDWICVS